MNIKEEIKSYLPAVKFHTKRVVFGLGIVTAALNILMPSLSFVLLCTVAYGLGYLFVKPDKTE